MSCPIVFWTCLCIVVLGIASVLAIKPSWSGYPNGRSKDIFEREYNVLLDTMEQLALCNEYSSASTLWYKVSHLFLRDSPWHLSVAENIAEQLDCLRYIKKLAEIRELVSYKITSDNKIKITYANEDGDIYTSDACYCSVKENTKIEHPILAWAGRVLELTVPYRGWKA